MGVRIIKDKSKKEIQPLIYGRVPPSACDLEEAVLGACMLEKTTFEDVKDVLHSEDCFYMDAHQKIWAAMNMLYASGTPIDLHTITEQLRRTSELEIVGGAYYLTKLTQAVLTGAHAKTHSFMIMEKFMKRELIRIAGSMINDAYSDETDVFELLDTSETEIKNITAHISSGDNITVLNSFQNVLLDYEKQKETKSTLIGISSGYSELDGVTGGWKTPALIILGGLPSNGKTALMLNLVQNATNKVFIENSPRVRIFSLETGDVSLTRRMASSMCKLPLEKLNKATLEHGEQKRLFAAMTDFSKLKIGISQRTFYIEDIERNARREKKKFPDLGLIMLDFIQLVKIRNPGKLSQKSEIVGEVSRRLKLLSAEIGVPIIALSQLNIRITKETKNVRPEIGNLANSTEIEQNADVIILIWYKDGIPILIVAKNKDGRCADVPMKFDADIQQWMDANDVNPNIAPSFFQGMNTAVNNFQASDWNLDT